MSLSRLGGKKIKSNCNGKYPQTSLCYYFLKCNLLLYVTQKLYLVTVGSIKYNRTSHHWQMMPFSRSTWCYKGQQSAPSIVDRGIQQITKGEAKSNR